MIVRKVILAAAILLVGCKPASDDEPKQDVPGSIPPAQISAFLRGDAKPTCPVPSETFQSWLKGHRVTEDGVVAHANSVGFAPASTDCDFCRWSE